MKLMLLFGCFLYLHLKGICFKLRRHERLHTLYSWPFSMLNHFSVKYGNEVQNIDFRTSILLPKPRINTSSTNSRRYFKCTIYATIVTRRFVLLCGYKKLNFMFQKRSCRCAYKLHLNTPKSVIYVTFWELANNIIYIF